MTKVSAVRYSAVQAARALVRELENVPLFRRASDGKLGEKDGCRSGGRRSHEQADMGAKEREIFVFGSNLAGRHGAGAALTARRKYGAEYGVGRGRTGNAYAIPTKGYRLEVLPLEEIEEYVKEFLDYAREHPELRFKVTAIGTGLAGYKHEQIAPMFRGAPKNCDLPREWRSIHTMMDFAERHATLMRRLALGLEDEN